MPTSAMSTTDHQKAVAQLDCAAQQIEAIQEAINMRSRTAGSNMIEIVRLRIALGDAYARLAAVKQ